MSLRFQLAKPGATIGALAVLLVTSQSIQARPFAEVYAECGIGATLFNSGSSGSSDGRTLAITSNLTWDLGTTALSSDVTSDSSCAGGSAATAELMMHTYPAIERDLARGEGEHLDAVLAASGCDADVHAALGQGLRADLAASTLDVEASRFDQVDYLHGSLMHRIESDYGDSCSV